jgi:hypothetical protein
MGFVVGGTLLSGLLPDDTLVKMLDDTRGAMPVDKWAAVPDDTWKISCIQIASFNHVLTITAFH